MCYCGTVTSLRPRLSTAKPRIASYQPFYPPHTVPLLWGLIFLSLRRLLLALPFVFGIAAALAAAPDAAPDPGGLASGAPDTRLPVHPGLRVLDPRVLGEGGEPNHMPDVLNPVKNVHGPFREGDLPGHDASKDPTPAYTEAERQQLIKEGKDLFFSTTAFGQRPSLGPAVINQQLSCATCH